MVEPKLFQKDCETIKGIYLRKKTYSIKYVLDFLSSWPLRKDDYFTFDGDRIIFSCRLQLFLKKGTDCVRCGVKGMFFAKERECLNEQYFLSLYAINKSNHEIKMTVDHIYPRSKGGRNNLNNYQPMCDNCNNKKGNSESVVYSNFINTKFAEDLQTTREKLYV